MIDLGEYFAVFRKTWWKIALFSLASGVVALAITSRMPNIYQTTAVVTPVTEEGKQSPTIGVLAAIG
ncbi:MAG TPA: Wzz/FepE/Etk N-terminal domain-containing protein, partial [Candidatus Deferrimicrobium sp.]|nr:Wzz/FepE/Etk N-terminal domain-containing protein [Candidatus Deferrimicrobium sp.]